MRDRWVLALLISIILAGASFFFFLGSLMRNLTPSASSGNIAVVEVMGGIFDPKDTQTTLRDLRDDKDVRAVIVRIDSPGGSIGASQEIYESIRLLKEIKPVIVSMGSVAASGGYYVALPASRILANPGTVTGSIGVRMETVNTEDLLAWMKVKPLTLKSGALKDAGSLTRAMTSEEKSYLEDVLAKMHLQFKKAVSENRHLDLSRVDALADGRIFTGEEALAQGLIDELGGFETAIRVAGEMAGLKEKPTIYYPEEESHPWVERLFDGFAEGVLKNIRTSFSGQPLFTTIRGRDGLCL